MPSNLSNALSYIVDAISMLILMVFLLRLVLPFLRADFRNPIAQGILKLTSPLVIPVRRIVPSVGRLDTATLLVTFAIQLAAFWFELTIKGASAPLAYLLYFSLISLLVKCIYLFMFAIFISIIISWIAPGQYSPIATIANTLSEPVLAPIRRFMPPLGGFDLSPIVALIGLRALSIIVAGINPF